MQSLPTSSYTASAFLLHLRATAYSQVTGSGHERLHAFAADPVNVSCDVGVMVIFRDLDHELIVNERNHAIPSLREIPKGLLAPISCQTLEWRVLGLSEPDVGELCLSLY